LYLIIAILVTRKYTCVNPAFTGFISIFYASITNKQFTAMSPN
jgi:hypothetical protein